MSKNVFVYFIKSLPCFHSRSLNLPLFSQSFFEPSLVFKVVPPSVSKRDWFQWPQEKNCVHNCDETVWFKKKACFISWCLGLGILEKICCQGLNSSFFYYFKIGLIGWRLGRFTKKKPRRHELNRVFFWFFIKSD